MIVSNERINGDNISPDPDPDFITGVSLGLAGLILNDR